MSTKRVSLNKRINTIAQHIAHSYGLTYRTMTDDDIVIVITRELKRYMRQRARNKLQSRVLRQLSKVRVKEPLACDIALDKLMEEDESVDISDILQDSLDMLKPRKEE